MSGGRPRKHPRTRLKPCPRCGGRDAYLAANSHCTWGYVCPCGFEGYGSRAYAPESESARGWNEAVAAWC
jgi:hypothetical protein